MKDAQAVSLLVVTPPAPGPVLLDVLSRPPGAGSQAAGSTRPTGASPAWAGSRNVGTSLHMVARKLLLGYEHRRTGGKCAG